MTRFIRQTGKTFNVMLKCCIVLVILRTIFEMRKLKPRLIKSLSGSLPDQNEIILRPIENEYEPPSSSVDSIEGRIYNQFRQCRSLKQNGYEFSSIRKSKLRHIIVNDKHKVLFCYVPKVACSNFKRMFLVLAGIENATDPLSVSGHDVHTRFMRNLTMLHKLSHEDVLYRLQNYKKVIFVRNPLVRLLSAYRNKFLQRGREDFKRTFGRAIIKMFRKNRTQESLKKGHDVKFSEFVDYLLDAGYRRHGYNDHWDMYYNVCSPCHVRYNFIGKYETIDEDVDLMLKDIGADKLVKLPDRANTYKLNKSSDVVEQFYKEISPEKIMKLYDIFKADFDIFGYDMPDVIRRIVNESTTIT